MAVPSKIVYALCVVFLAAAQATQTTQQTVPTVWLMGEVHDNPQAHEARYEMIAAKVKTGWRPAIAMEQFDREHQGLLRTAQDQCKQASCITSQPWVENWQWELYEPLIQLAIDYQLPLLAANVSREEANRIVKGGYGAALTLTPLPNMNWTNHCRSRWANSIVETLLKGTAICCPSTLQKK